jgi:hypothetical protein
MTYSPTQPEPDSAQLELMTGLLEGEGADAYVVIPVGALVSQLRIALDETRTRDHTYRPGRATVRLVRNLHTLGWIRDTAHPRDQVAES